MTLTPFLVFGGSALIFSLLGAVFSATEAAYQVSSRTDLETLAESGVRRWNRSLARALQDPAATLSMLAFLRIFFESAAAVFMTIALVQLNIFASSGAIVLWALLLVAVLSFFTVIFGPRAYGSKFPNVTIKTTATLVRGARILLAPLVFALGKAPRFSGGLSLNRAEKQRSEQLISMVDRAAEQDLLEEEEQGIIRSVLEFGDTIVRELMVPRTEMVTIDADASVRDALEELMARRHSRAPVISEGSDDVVGVVYLRDLAGLMYRKYSESESYEVRRIMKPAQFVPDLQRADDLLRKMQQEANHLALVVDEYGGIAGLVTLEDLIEELVGDITDEHDKEEAGIDPLEDGSFLVNAHLEIEKLGELFDVPLSDEDVETVGGLVSKHLGRLAEENDVVVVSGIVISVHEMERKRKKLKTLLAKRSEEPESDE